MQVTAKIDAGWHPIYGDIFAGKAYDIDGDISPELFDLANPEPQTEETPQ